MTDPSLFNLSESNLLLCPHDPPPVVASNRNGASPFLLIGDHAGRAVPQRLGNLGLDTEALDLHIAWDIGIAGLGLRLAEALDACFISQAYSRLVIDCNRTLSDPSSIVETSDRVSVPGNIALPFADRVSRQVEIYHPYHDAIAAELDRRIAGGMPVKLVSLHSFTPVYQGFQRPWRMGVLHRNDSQLSAQMLARLQAELGETAGDNQPYALDEKDNTIPLHADPRGLDYLELEIRQDLIAAPQEQAAMALTIRRLLLEIR